MPRLVVIGGVAAGMSAAAKAKRLQPGWDVDVYTDDEYVSYSGCCLPYYTQGLMEEIDGLIIRTPEQLAKQGIGLHMRHRVTGIDPAGKTFTHENPGGQTTTEGYDRLVIATGARPVVPKIPGADLPCVHTVKQVGDVKRIRGLLRGGGIKKVVVVGGGFIGVEMLDAFSAYGVEMSLVEMAPQILTILDADMAERIEDHLAEQGVAVYTNEGVQAIEAAGKGAKVVTGSRELEADLVLLAIGVTPNSELARDAGMELGARGAIAVNSRMETSAPHIWAAGDCAVARHILTRKDVYIPLGTTANKQGRIAGENAVGGSVDFGGVIGTSIFKAFEMEGSRTGLSLREAEGTGFAAWESTVTADTIVDTYPGAGKMTVKLVLEKGTDRLLGGQIAGSQKSAKRIDVLVALIQMGATLKDLAKLDLSYAPPFADAWDALLVAANVALSKRGT